MRVEMFWSRRSACDCPPVLRVIVHDNFEWYDAQCDGLDELTDDMTATGFGTTCNVVEDAVVRCW